MNATRRMLDEDIRQHERRIVRDRRIATGLVLLMALAAGLAIGWKLLS